MNRTKQESWCRSCGRPIVFVRTRSGKWMPCEADSVSPGDEVYEPRRGHDAHWAHCAQAEAWRQKAKGG